MIACNRRVNKVMLMENPAYITTTEAALATEATQDYL